MSPLQVINHKLTEILFVAQKQSVKQKTHRARFQEMRMRVHDDSLRTAEFVGGWGCGDSFLCLNFGAGEAQVKRLSYI